MSDSASEPWVLLVPEKSTKIRRQLSELTAKGGLVHHLDARDLMTEQGVFRTFAETLRFPGYFGRNWDALVDCVGDLCGEVTGGGAGIVCVVHDADRLLWTGHFPLLVSVLCQGADRANSAVDLDGDPLDRPAVAEHFVLEFRDFDGAEIAARVEQPGLTVTTRDGFVGVALDPEEWH
ncbi:barstar family protein [Streptomyces arenae]|uniref:barstar family protein n=1 Tax=Streptomyces arenae TaxID=29301 RepID=UPI00265893DB|nr:barstar family protein [Streptomyces arenae]MCG7207144.1 barstar family protein [Streptomyces arenae]